MTLFSFYEIKISDFAEMFDLKTDKSLYEKVEKIADELLGKKLYLKKKINCTGVVGSPKIIVLS